MRLKLNKEFALRHLGVAALMAALGGWFAYDGYVAYPAADAMEMYAKAHGGERAQSVEQAEKYRQNAIPRQKQFMMLAWAFSAYLLVNLAYLWRKEYDFGGKITEVDEKDWEKKGILRFKVDGKQTVLDAWHHEGVKELREKILKNEIGG